ncbi:MAG TPA: hypothetical protein VN193_08680 [Candidatus Angelobacter sp.]|jgi:hypothetical protein|nr:hypothetical protein [Candidatus Angelobacter sp.]
MPPRWFRALVVAESAAAIALAVVGVRLVVHGVHAAGDALTWLRPAHHAPPLPSPLPDLGGTLAAPPTHATQPVIAGIETLTPQLFARLNRQTGAFAEAEYALLLDLESLARDEATRLLSGVHVPPAP